MKAWDPDNFDCLHNQFKHLVEKVLLQIMSAILVFQIPAIISIS